MKLRKLSVLILILITLNAFSQTTCDFGTPASSPLATTNHKTYSYVHVLGDGGPNLSNITNFTINWSLENNGLYQFSLLTNNGIPSWWNDLLSKVTHNFNQNQPGVTISSSGFPGLDGSYWVATDNGNFVLVSKTANYRIYFSNSAIAPTCVNKVVAEFSATPTYGTAPLLVDFDASASYDTDGQELTYTWDFGDGNTAVGVVVQNTYTANGIYQAKLTVSDGLGSEGEKVIPISVTDDNGPGDNEYFRRFNEIRSEFYDPANGYFSADGSPHHSIETLIVEAPDYGHESTSELYSYWIWLEVMHGKLSGDWSELNNVWTKLEQFIIPTHDDQPTNAQYDPSSPATYAPEFPLPDDYPSPLNFSAPVGVDPISPDLTATYGEDVYQMHWLLDNDNFYGYGNRGDGTSTPSYINTFQRGEQESVWETIPHPSWEEFNWGGQDGFLPFFIGDQTYSKQWRYTSAPDADARVVQAMYWAQRYAKEQGISISNLDMDKAVKMGDYLRLAMFDKYFKPMGVQSETNGAGTGYDSAHYLMSWYISWGGSVGAQYPWAYRISASHCHFGYQNPVAAYALTQEQDMRPLSQNGHRDWSESLTRQMEFYEWLQSKEGAIAGGATNSWNGNYSTYPSGKATFYDMAYDDNPVYHDPGSGTWFGWQAWSMERVAEYYYITNDARAKKIMDKWVGWVKSEVRLLGSDDFEIPSTLEWSGQPDTWNANNPGANNGLSVNVVNYGKDLGIAASLAKALIYYAAATREHGKFDAASRDLAKEILDRMWRTYRDDKGVSAPESRGDYSRFFTQEVFVPNSYNGTMANGDAISPGATFLSIRSNYYNDPEFPALQAAYESGVDYTTRYHRSWAQIEVALANAEYGLFFGEDTSERLDTPKSAPIVGIGPNPTSDILNIYVGNEGKGDVEIRLIDLSGRVIKTDLMTNGQQSTQMSLGKLPSGLYILETNDLSINKVQRNKIIIK
ncbi:glycoside hydrolase family 48 protein [Tenacibaculum amylolyticum]|uniref:glycoside hydrolase family 48 protein n=1 Tax=Tenacibaculum amylolyticum TaxID=104269 RepID=UPI00389389BA